jgi:ankyrin repeat protein
MALPLSWGSEIDTELVSQASGGNIERVRSLIRQGANLEAVAFETWTPLTAAADQGHLTVVKELKAAGANLNTPDGAGNTPLFYAAVKGRIEVARFLLKEGGRINDWARTKQYVVESVKKNGNLELIQLIESLQ